MNEAADVNNIDSLNWIDDKLNRKPYSKFLTNYLCIKVANGGSPIPFVMALDAKWGEGKTFFVSKWARDLRNASPGHIVIEFDAWTSDYAQDALMAFMSELKASLDKEVLSSGLAPAAVVVAKRGIATAMKSFRAALMPLAGMVAKGAVKKISGTDFDDLVALFVDENEDESLEDEIVGGAEPVIANEVGEEEENNAALDAVNKKLDAIFTRRLSEHADRKMAINDFKRAIKTTLEVLTTDGKKKGPLFIFVDELDRCRPSFAVSLLEAIKHLFDIDGVCFVVSTNLEQLAHTVKAVYGEGFDSSTYLQRFFNVQFGMPPSVGLDFITLQLEARPLLTNQGRCLPRNDVQSNEEDALELSPADSIKWVFDSFELAPRAQKMVIELMDAAATGIPIRRPIHTIFLAILCVIKCISNRDFDSLALPIQDGGIASKIFTNLLKKAITVNVSGFNNDGGRVTYEVDLRAVFLKYILLSNEGVDKISDRTHRTQHSRKYPESLDSVFSVEAPNPRTRGVTIYPSVALYFNLIRNAGYLLSVKK